MTTTAIYIYIYIYIYRIEAKQKQYMVLKIQTKFLIRIQYFQKDVQMTATCNVLRRQ